MGVPVDRALVRNSSFPPTALTAGTPAETPGPMPPQDLRRFDRARRRKPHQRPPWLTPLLVRTAVFGGTLAMAAVAVNQMRLVLNVGGLTLLEILVLVLFAINVTWILFPLTTAAVGLVRVITRRRRDHAVRPLHSRTALLMPTYNEDPAQVASALEAMAQGLVDHGEGRSFDVFVLSDTTDGAAARAEHEVIWALRRRLGHRIDVHYRRRLYNRGHKAGNLKDFCERWGRSYDHLVVLDADSLLGSATIIELVRRMEDDPDVGLIQTVPQLQGGTTLVARVQQFAGLVYGSLLAAGLAWWTRNEGTYWGHNAIIRTRAFMEAAGLPDLPGQPPFGGPILSHDFVEAALLRRAGWRVIIADDLHDSFEQCPPSIIDLAVRNRRWCQGNLQHTRILGAKGLHWVSRLHLLNGIFSYVSSPLWLLFLIATLALGVQNEFAKPEYFTRSYTLFPLWPHLDPVRAMRLFGFTLAILFGPKALGFLWFIASPKRLRGAGILLPISVAFEILLSALIAPILMLIDCGIILDILRGKDSGWRPQRRADDSLRWSQILYRHRWHMVMGAVLIAASRFISWQMLAWLLPAVVGMMLAVPVSQWTGSAAVGRWFRRMGVLRVPTELESPAIVTQAQATYPIYRDVAAAAPDLLAIAADRKNLERHLALVDRAPHDQGIDPVDPVQATANLKIERAGTRQDAVAVLTPQECARVQSVPELLLRISALPDRAEVADEE
jgi:membrane glycosyltransferase